MGQSEEYQKVHKKHRFVACALPGVMGAQNVLFAKCTVELLMGMMAGGAIMFLHIETYMIIGGLSVSIYFQLKWMNEALQKFDSLYVVPTFQAFWNSVSTIAGLIFFQEYQDMTATATLMFPLGMAIQFIGMFVLAGRD